MEMLKNVPVAALVFGIAAGLLVAVLVGGLVISLVANIFSGWVATTAPSEKVMTDWSNQQLKATASELAARKTLFNWTPSSEPIWLSIFGFVIVFFLATFFVRVPPLKGGEATDGAPQALTALKACSKADQCDLLVKQLPAADPSKGKGLYEDKGCVGCHSLEKGKVLVGPSFYGVFTRAATREPGYGAKDYIYESVINPNKFIVPNFQAGIMNAGYVKELKPQDLADIIAWMEKDLAQTD